MKANKRFFAMAAALALTACVAAPMSMTASATSTVTITGISTAQTHTFEVYQVFKGDLEGGTFTNLKWGSGVSTYDSTSVTPGAFVDNTIIDALGTDARVIANKIVTNSTKIQNSGSDWTSSTSSLVITVPEDGYYLIKDVTNLDNANEANSAIIVQVAGTASVPIKNAKPTFDKLVQDETTDADANADANGWGETADHAINESFQFKLKATIPADNNLAAYDTYTLTFTDTMTSGVTFESIESVKVGSTTLTSSQYSTQKKTGENTWGEGPTSGDAGAEWKLNIADVKTLAGASWGTTAIDVEVIYNAHLNENAVVDSASRSGGTVSNTNGNRAKLTYSNNPDNTGEGTNNTGETTEDNVWVFTYKVDNVKKQISESGAVLPNAKFQIKSGSTAIKLIDNKDGTYTVANQSASLTTEVNWDTDNPRIVDTMISNASGIFNIKGLDAGTYTLHESEAPSGYNAASDKTITITATHSETSETANLTLSEGSTMSNTIVDTKNNTLPSTGGIGTRIFVLGGGATAALAGIYLVSRRRTKEEMND